MRLARPDFPDRHAFWGAAPRPGTQGWGRPRPRVSPGAVLRRPLGPREPGRPGGDGRNGRGNKAPGETRGPRHPAHLRRPEGPREPRPRALPIIRGSQESLSYLV